MDAELHRTSISAGLVIYKLLSGDPSVKGMATKIFPVAVTAESVNLPFIVFRAVKQEPTETKPQKGYDSCLIAVDCAAENYEDSVTLAELARAAIEDKECEIEGLSLGISLLTDREEFYEEDAYVERLIFTITI